MLKPNNFQNIFVLIINQSKSRLESSLSCCPVLSELKNMGTIPIKKSLCKLANKYLTPHPTSTNVERLFSTAGNVVKGRGRLKPENVEKLVFLKENLNLNNFKLDW